MKISVIQKSKTSNEVLYKQTFTRDTAEEIIGIIKYFCAISKDYDSSYLTYEIEE